MSVDIVEPKPGVAMGRVVVEVLVEKWVDSVGTDGGETGSRAVPRATVTALVDTGATCLSLPGSVIADLGLRKVGTRRVRTVNGIVARDIFATAQITVQGRDCRGEVMALPEASTPLLGQLALEGMDWWVDLTNGRLVGNPEHGGEWMADAY